MEVGGNTGRAARQNLAVLRNETLQGFWVLPVDCLDLEIDATARHRAVCFAERRTTSRCFRLHEMKKLIVSGLLRLAVESVTLQVWVVFLFLQAGWSVWALFIPCGNVAGNRFAFCFRFRAFEDDKIACHRELRVF